MAPQLSRFRCPIRIYYQADCYKKSGVRRLKPVQLSLAEMQHSIEKTYRRGSIGQTTAHPACKRQNRNRTGLDFAAIFLAGL